MMKSKFRLSCMAMLASAAMSSLGSCSSDELLDGTNTLPENAIAFNVTQQGALSRGTETNSGNFQNQIKDFQVWAYFDKSATGTGVTPGGLYVGDSHTIGTKVNGDSNGAWSYDDVTKQQYWPATTAPLNFQAITPYAHSSFTIENTPDVADPKLAHVTANVTVPTAVADQQDIMFAKADGQTRETNSQTVGLNFQHAMSQVVFSGKLASDKIEATVHGIEIHNLHNTGKVGYMGTNAELQAQTTGEAGTTFAAGLVDNPVVNSSSQATVLSAADGALFMLPQTVAKWTTTAKNPVPTSEADANHNSYLKVTCTVKDKASGVVLVNNGSIYIPLEVNWQQGKKYSYTLVFGQGEQGFKPDGSHDDNLLQIKYSVSAENWNAAGNEDLGMGGGFEKPFKPDPLTYTPGTNVKLIHKAEYCKSIIADGKELITGNERGTLSVPELNDEKVYITFKEDLTDLSNAFYGCLALKSIPENLFANCPKVTVFGATFNNCTALTTIPENLFANNPEVTTFKTTFYSCRALTVIPEKIFANCPNVTNFQETFSNCTALTTIPENLFANNPKVTTFERTFEGCSALKSIPEKLFVNNPAVTTFSHTFWYCSALTTIPEGLFANNPEVYSFNNTFNTCTALKSIPENLFSKNPKVTDFSTTFRFTALTSIPENLFAHNPKVTDFDGTFSGCSALTGIPTSLFDNNRKVNSFMNTFRGCSALTGESPYTMIGDKKVHLYERKNYPDHFTEPTSFMSAFSFCPKLTDYYSMPSIWRK